MSDPKTIQNPPNETAAETATRTARELANQASTAAGTVAKDVQDAAASQANAAKSSVADEMSGVASALRTAASEMRNGSPQERTFGQIAESLADASDAVRGKDLSTMVHDVTAFARANPLVFLGGAALVGFAATRFAKASNTTNAPASHATSDTSTSHLPTPQTKHSPYVTPQTTKPGDYS